MKDLIVYVHGKGGSAGEAAYYKTLFPNREVIGFDYRSQTPWEAKKEFFAFFAEKKAMQAPHPNSQQHRCVFCAVLAGSNDG